MSARWGASGTTARRARTGGCSGCWRTPRRPRVTPGACWGCRSSARDGLPSVGAQPLQRVVRALVAWVEGQHGAVQQDGVGHVALALDAAGQRVAQRRAAGVGLLHGAAQVLLGLFRVALALEPAA